MFGIGMQELVIIMVVALLVLGPSRLPQVARTLGKGMREFRKASDDLRSAMWVDLDEERPNPAIPPPASLPAPSPASPSSASGILEEGGVTEIQVTPVRNLSASPAEIDLGPGTSEAAQPPHSPMPRAAEGIVARGAPNALVRSPAMTSHPTELKRSPDATEGAAETLVPPQAQQKQEGSA